nr:ornithine cyclodeaminase family protein [Arthrobacter pigmenti]
MTYLDAAALRDAIDERTAVAVLEEALRTDVDPEHDSPRLFSDAPAGQFLLMPTAGKRYSGVKLATIAPDNPAAGKPKIQGVYTLFDSGTLSPLILMDGAELTLTRTPATTALAVKHLLAADPRRRGDAARRAGAVVVFGAGPQAWRHILAVHAVAPIDSVAIVGRTPEKADALVRRCMELGLDARPGSAADVAGADVVLCVSSASEPLFDANLVQPHAVVAAVGSHGLDAREIDPELARRADVVVEGRASAMRESGDLIPARSVEEWQEHGLTNLAELVHGELARRADRPALFTGVGMSWEDLAVATAVYEGQLP